MARCQGAPAVLELRREFDLLYPRRDRSSDGICASAAHHKQNAASDHEPDKDGLATAVDIDEDIVSGWNDRQLWEVSIRLLADHRTKYIIYERRIMYPDGRNKLYTGINAHQHHMHVSVTQAGKRDTSKWDIIDVRGWLKDPNWKPLPSPVPLVPVPQEENDMATRTFRPNGTGPEQAFIGNRRVTLTADDKDFLEDIGLLQKDQPPKAIHPQVADYLFGPAIARPAGLP